MTPNIHIAYGFHVNCYHSYRGDSNDRFGFGSDIRIIEKTLDILTAYNEAGVSVKGTWDTENFFSLEKILPEYAPQIIEKMKLRVEKYGDENIIMGYSNGALGAMTEAELKASIELAVHNEQGSGLKDIFGECAMLVRPQEVMFTPSQVPVYKRLGVEALCLYYSCVPFDAFRTIVPKLSDELAFNPLSYTYKNDSLTILPTYSNADVADAGCLRAWVKELHAKQEKGEITHDLLIFINMDADSFFWETMELPLLTGKLANMDGIHGLIKEVADLPYVVFDTPGNYLKTHKPLGTIDFTHDTADGNFTGYTSWAEKPYNRKIWTAIDRTRAMAKLNSPAEKDAASFLERVQLLSTTHFGLATPVLNIEREKKANALAAAILEKEKALLPKTGKLTLHNTSNSTILSAQVKRNENNHPVWESDLSKIQLKGQGLKDYVIFPTDNSNNTYFLICEFEEIKPCYELELPDLDIEICPSYSSLHSLTAGNLRLEFSPNGKLTAAYLGEKQIGDESFLESFLGYKNKQYHFENTHISPLMLGGNGTGLRTTGEIHLPNELRGGSFTYDFISTPLQEGILLRSEVNYPYTSETTSISTENSSLGRFSDMDWREAVPLQITPKFTGDVQVIKRNFMEDISSFRSQSFPECDPKNTSVSSFNHQLSAGLVGLGDESYCLLLANARQVLGSMAHCPMRLDVDKTIHMNPFGTYYGPQRHHWGRSKDEILGCYNLISAQGKPIAPSYNGCSETALLQLCALPVSHKELLQAGEAYTPYRNTTGGEGSDVPAQALSHSLQQLLAFADGAIVTAPEDCPLQPFYEDNIHFEKPVMDRISEKELKSPILTGMGEKLPAYIKNGSKAFLHMLKAQWKSRK